MYNFETLDGYDNQLDVVDFQTFLEGLKSEEVEKAPSMEIQACEIAETFLEVPELRYENWRELNLNERINVLQNFEAEVATIEVREVSEIRSENINGCLGMFQPLTRDIVLNENLLMSDSREAYMQTMETYFHEGRHAYQHHNLYVEQTEQNSELVNAWNINENILGYNSGDYGLFGYEEYVTQPVELDANVFAETVMDKLDLGW